MTPVSEKTYPEGWRIAFDQDCEPRTASVPELSNSEPRPDAWADQFENFFQHVPRATHFFGAAVSQFKTIQLTPESIRSWANPQSETETDFLPGFETYLGRDTQDPSETLNSGLKLCLRKTDAPVPPASQEDTASARRRFIHALADPIADPDAKRRFTGILQGWLTSEPDASQWQEIYQNQFGWSEAELQELDEDSLAFEHDLSEDLAEDVQTKAWLAEHPKTSGYLAGLIGRAQYVYGLDGPDFAEEYQNYVEFTLNALASEDALHELRNQLKSPEEYRATGFVNLPPRPDHALSGSEFMENVLGVDLEEFKKNPRQLGKLSKAERENAILEQIELGNIPDFLRRPKPVVIVGPDGGKVTTYVMPDYIAIGSNEDFVRVPLSPIIAQALAHQYGLNLPTKTIVEETYHQAGKQIVGPFYSRATEMEANSAYLDSAGFYLRSSQDIQDQLDGVAPGTLVSGGKKELVVSPFVARRYVGSKPDESIAFYGLYDGNGIPIQRTAGHGGEMGWRHTEYALGVRFISPMIVYRDRDGERKVMRMDDALKDPEICKIISRLERTDEQWNIRSTLRDGPFDPATVYQQKPPKGQRMPHGPDGAS